jgi:hypothetical protein
MATILSLILQLSGISTQRVAERVAGISVLFALSLVFMLLGVAGLSAAVWIQLSRMMDPLLAALIIGSVCMIIAAILMLVAKSRSNTDHILYGRKKLPEAPAAPDSALVMLPLAVMALVGFALSSRKPKD